MWPTLNPLKKTPETAGDFGDRGTFKPERDGDVLHVYSGDSYIHPRSLT